MNDQSAQALPSKRIKSQKSADFSQFDESLAPRSSKNELSDHKECSKAFKQRLSHNQPENAAESSGSLNSNNFLDKQYATQTYPFQFGRLTHEETEIAKGFRMYANIFFFIKFQTVTR